MNGHQLFPVAARPARRTGRRSPPWCLPTLLCIFANQCLCTRRSPGQLLALLFAEPIGRLEVRRCTQPLTRPRSSLAWEWELGDYGPGDGARRMRIAPAVSKPDPRRPPQLGGFRGIQRAAQFGASAPGVGWPPAGACGCCARIPASDNRCPRGPLLGAPRIFQLWPSPAGAPRAHPKLV